MKLELLKILIHQLTGKRAIIKSPHLPWALYEVTNFGLNFNVLCLTNREKINKYKHRKKVNQYHHQYCQCVKFNKMSDELSGKPKL